jgi:hypothetical protein
MFNYCELEAKNPEFWSKLQKYKVKGKSYEYEKTQTVLLSYVSKSQYTALPINLRYSLTDQIELVITSSKSTKIYRANSQGLFMQQDTKWKHIHISGLSDPAIDLWDNDDIIKQLFEPQPTIMTKIKAFKFAIFG